MTWMLCFKASADCGSMQGPAGSWKPLGAISSERQALLILAVSALWALNSAGWHSGYTVPSQYRA